MKATPAYTGYFKYGEWLPIYVDLENQGGDLDGDIRIDINTSQGTLVFDAPVSLPSGSHKLVPVYVLPNNFSRELTVNLVSKDKTVASQKASVRPQPNISYFVGLIAPQRGALALLNGARFPGQERPKILVDLSLADLPERAEGLGSFDLLVLNDTDTSKLTPEQASALAGWVQLGGRLVIGGGVGTQQTLSGLPENMLAVQFEGTSEINTGSLGALASYTRQELPSTTGTFVLGRSTARKSTGAQGVEGLRTLVAAGEVPLVQEWKWGAGFVNFIAIDLAGVPLNGWPGKIGRASCRERV
jgi:hypothetical protein